MSTHRGEAVTRIALASRCSGADVKALLRHQRPDKEWASQLAETRAMVQLASVLDSPASSSPSLKYF